MGKIDTVDNINCEILKSEKTGESYLLNKTTNDCFWLGNIIDVDILNSDSIIFLTQSNNKSYVIRIDHDNSKINYRKSAESDEIEKVNTGTYILKKVYDVDEKRASSTDIYTLYSTSDGKELSFDYATKDEESGMVIGAYYLNYDAKTGYHDDTLLTMLNPNTMSFNKLYSVKDNKEIKVMSEDDYALAMRSYPAMVEEHSSKDDFGRYKDRLKQTIIRKQIDTRRESKDENINRVYGLCKDELAKIYLKK